MFTANLLAQHTCGTISIPWVNIPYYKKSHIPQKTEKAQHHRPQTPSPKTQFKTPTTKLQTTISEKKNKTMDNSRKKYSILVLYHTCMYVGNAG